MRADIIYKDMPRNPHNEVMTRLVALITAVAFVGIPHSPNVPTPVSGTAQGFWASTCLGGPVFIPLTGENPGDKNPPQDQPHNMPCHVTCRDGRTTIKKTLV